MARLAWIDRSWRFGAPVEHHPLLVERLRGTPARLGELVRDLPVQLAARRYEGSWSIQENVGHLLDLEYLPRVRLEELLAGAEVLTAADMSNRATEEARHGERSMTDLLAGFRRERMALVARLDALEPADFARSALHPRLSTPMQLVDMCLFHAEHDGHHLARITELSRLLGARS